MDNYVHFELNNKEYSLSLTDNDRTIYIFVNDDSLGSFDSHDVSKVVSVITNFENNFTDDIEDDDIELEDDIEDDDSCNNDPESFMPVQVGWKDCVHQEWFYK